VVPLLHAAAKSRFVDVVMFKYNFRSYGDKELNDAIDAAHRAGIGLIAMKTQGSAISFSERVNPFVEQGLSKHQAVLKAVWKDGRIASAVSCMPSVQVLEQNAAATRQALTAAEAEAIERYAAETRSLYCSGGCGGCRRECEAATGRRVAIADALRYLMYHDSYGWRGEARRKYARLRIDSNLLSEQDLYLAEAACPRGVAVRELLARADRTLSA
jgi:predicted aldo/keto reductase-like oxidoreductase